MKDLPILFTGPNVLSILNGRKLQTRRIVLNQPTLLYGAWHWVCKKLDAGYCHTNIEALRRIMLPFCPYGKVGDQLWVRETHMVNDVRGNKLPESERSNVEILYRATDMQYLNNCEDTEGLRWTPSIFMPRWASRIQLEITGVRVERLQDISYNDAIAEGWNPKDNDGKNPNRYDPKTWYRHLWQEINGAGSWEANPWVWVIEFRRINNGL